MKWSACSVMVTMVAVVLTMTARSVHCKNAVTGTWQNEKTGAFLYLQASDGGVLSGVYQSGMGDASGNFTLSGLWNVPADSDITTSLAFTVAWTLGTSKTNSVTAWSGQLVCPDAIVTHWLHTTYTPNSTELRTNTGIGTDIFVLVV